MVFTDAERLPLQFCVKAALKLGVVVLVYLD